MPASKSISMGGLFIETFVALDLGARIDVRVAILHQVFSVPTEVVWSVRDRTGRGRGLGVRFVAMPAAMGRAIAEFMRQRPPITFEVERHG